MCLGLTTYAIANRVDRPAGMEKEPGERGVNTRCTIYGSGPVLVVSHFIA